MGGKCVACGEVVDTRGYGWYRQVIGWEEKRRDGGANKISGRETTGQLLHHGCMTKQRQHPGQGSMFG